MKRVAVYHGLFEGPFHSRRFKAALRARGFRTVKRSASADIVLTHSGGCFMLRNPRPHQHIFHVNPPFWPDRPLFVRFLNRLANDMRIFVFGPNRFWHLQKTFWNLFYLLCFLPYWLFMRHRYHRSNFDELFKQSNVTIIRNQNDTMSTPDFATRLEGYKGLKFLELPGEHDDLWLHPERYIDAIESRAENHS